MIAIRCSLPELHGVGVDAPDRPLRRHRRRVSGHQGARLLETTRPRGVVIDENALPAGEHGRSGVRVPRQEVRGRFRTRRRPCDTAHPHRASQRNPVHRKCTSRITVELTTFGRVGMCRNLERPIVGDVSGTARQPPSDGHQKQSVTDRLRRRRSDPEHDPFHVKHEPGRVLPRSARTAHSTFCISSALLRVFYRFHPLRPSTAVRRLSPLSPPSPHSRCTRPAGRARTTPHHVRWHRRRMRYDNTGCSTVQALQESTPGMPSAHRGARLRA
jgi:hypothetical protein